MCPGKNIVRPRQSRFTLAAVIRAILPLGLLLAALASAGADILSDLSADDQHKVKSGAQVMLTESLAGYPWPKVRVYQFVNASPREVIAVFTDYNNATTFVPNCLKSEISKTVSRLVTDVDYVIDVPILADEAYTVRDTLSAEPDGALKVHWKMLKATSIQESEGNLLAEPMGNGSIIRYTNLVKPSSMAAPLLRGVAMSQMKDTVNAIVEHVEKQKSNPVALKTELNRLDSALGSKD